MDQQLALFKELTEAYGAPGFEGPVRDIMRRHLSETTDEIVTDGLGGIFGVKRGNPNGPTVMAAGHMDEVALMVTRVDKNGFLKFSPLGGWWDQVLLSQRVVVMGRKGIVHGVIGSIPPHVLTEDDRKKPYSIARMFVDIGATSDAEVAEMGIRPGDPIVPTGEFKVLGNPNRLLAKSWDNRYGCAIAVELMQELKDVETPNILYAGANVQEEVGLRGARTAARMIEPDIFIAMDASPANDIPGSADGFGRLGEGVLMRILDRTMITLPGIRDFLIDTCESEGIPYQFFISSGGTDAGEVHTSGTGVPSVVIGIPSRYIHSHVSIIDKDDYTAAKKLLTTVVKKLDRSTVESIRRY